MLVPSTKHNARYEEVSDIQEHLPHTKRAPVRKSGEFRTNRVRPL